MVTKVLGLDRLRQKIKGLRKAARDEIVAAMEKAAADVVAMAKNLVPVDDGDLRDSIGWTWGDPPKGARVFSRSRPMKALGDMRISIYAGDDKAFYARFVEFGTAAHSVEKGADRSSRRKKKLGGRMHAGARATPFFYPAWRANRKRVKSQVSRAINKAAKKVAADKGTLKK